jgi:iron complex outermembrane receptor protein
MKPGFLSSVAMQAALAAVAIAGLPCKAAAAAEGAKASATIEEIVVTARKREESLQDVPMAVTAVTARTIEQRGIRDTKDLFSVTPGLFYSQSGQRQSDEQFFLTIRGVGATPVVEPSVAVFVDGAYMPSLGWTMDFLDLDRVEVLRGPQGALFGRNTEGGALNVVTHQPGRAVEAHLNGEVADFGVRQLSGGVSGPLSSDVSAGLNAFGSTTDGYMRNTTRGEPQDDRDRFGARATVAYAPNDRIDIVTSIDYLRSYGRFDALGDAAPSAVVTIADPHAGAAVGTTIRRNTLAGQDYTTFGGDESTTRVRNYGATLNAQIKLGWADLTAITSARSIRSFDQYDADGTATAVSTNGATTEQREWAQEIRLASNHGGAVDWIAGLYGFSDKLVQRRLSTYVSGISVRPQAGQPFGFTQDDVEIDRTGYALFSQVDWHVTDRLNASLGLRYASDSVDQTPDFHVRVNITPGPGNVSADNTTPKSGTFDGWSPSFNLSYKLTPSVLTYGSVTTGFKAGGFAREIQNTAAQNLPIANETSLNYELGVKGEYFERRLIANAAVFYTKLDNQQLTVRVPLTPGSSVAVPTVENAGKSHIQGFELEATARPQPSLTMSGSLSYTDAKFDQFIADSSGGIVYDRSGQRFPEIPRWMASAFVQKELHLAGDLTLTPRVAWRYIGDKFVGQGSAAVPFVQLDAYQVVDIQAALAKDNWVLTAFVNNVGDTYYVTNRVELQSIFAPAGRTSYQRPGPPRQVGLKAALKF